MTRETSRSATALRETAGSHMVKHIPQAAADTPVNVVIRSLQGQQFECADTIFVTDAEGRLEGIVRINDLLANSERPIGEIMEPQHEAVRSEDDQEQIAVLAMQLNMIAVPVVDNDERLIGAVPPEALFRILRAEHMEDLQRLAGIAPHARGPAVALRAPLFDRFRRRLPWLVFGLFASSIITFVMVGFEQVLSTNVAVAFFVPALVYIAGAIGTQAVSVAVQGLSTENISIKALLQDELVIGIAIGASLGLISSILVFVAFGDSMLSLAVGLAVLTGGTVSAVVGFGLPWIFKHFDFDPALGSGPICTIIQDVSSLLIYFVLVGALVL
jgi:magnesium transporter